MFGISHIYVMIGALILILMGLIVAYKGFDLLKDFVRSTGAVVVGLLLFIVGGIVGLFFGPIIAVVAAVAGGIIGIILGALLAPTLLWLLFSIIVFVICFNLGATGAESLGATDMVSLIAGLVIGLLGSWLISHLARAVLVGATSVTGGLMAGAGTYLILLGYVDFTIALGAGIGAFALVALTGYGANRKKGRSGSKKKRKKHRDR